MNITIERILPCLADPEKIRFVASIDEDVSGILPYLNSILPKTIYNHSGKSLTITIGEKIITIYSNKIFAGKIIDENDANEMIKWIKEKIEFCMKNKDRIEPDYRRKDKLEILHVYKLLPQKNCKKCGENSCLAFSTKLVNEEKTILDCKEIFLPEHDEKRKLLFDMLKGSGYKVPF